MTASFDVALALPDGPLLEGSLGDDPLLPEPATGGGAFIGYAPGCPPATSAWTASTPP